MTSVEIIGAEVTRLVSTLPDIDPTKDTDRYHKLLDCCHSLMSLGWQIDEHNRCAELTPVCTCNELPKPVFIPHTPEHPVDNVTPFPEPSTEEYTAPVMEGAVTTDKIAGGSLPEGKLSDEPEKTYTKEEVRAALARSRKKGINVTELMQDLGYDNFTAVPAAKYGEIMAKLGES